MSSDTFRYIVLPVLIFACRVFDVSLGTIRIIFVSRGKKMLAPLLGFFEVFVWVFAISQLMQHLDNIFTYIAYAGGFATGNFIGIMLEEKLAIGLLLVRIILSENDENLVAGLRNEGFGITVVDGQGANGPVKIIYTLIKRKDLVKVENIINECHPKAFYSVEDAKSAQYGVFPARHAMGSSPIKKLKIRNALGKRK